MRKALFLDRDGIINVEKNYVCRIEDFEFMSGIFDLARAAQEAGYLLIIVTNQSGIAREYYKEEDFHNLTRWMLTEFERYDIMIDKVYYCPFHPEAVLSRYKSDSFDRKPNPGMILRAQKDFGLDLANSALVGDKESDIEAGRRAGIGKLILLSEYSSSANTLNIVTLPTLYAIKPFLYNT